MTPETELPEFLRVLDLKEASFPVEWSDDAAADEFSRRNPDLKYVAAHGVWRRFDGVRWADEKTLLALDRARATCRALAGLTDNRRLRDDLSKRKTIAAVEFLARADRRHAMLADVWDAADHLINTPAGTYDARLHRLRPHSSDDLITKVTAVGPGGDCPLWQETLLRIFGGDHELVAYLQRAFGYMCTGFTSEHALFFGHGTGANGKTTIVRTLEGILGDYAISAPADTFLASDQQRHPTELASLVGRRLVIVSEIDEGKRWNESRIKALTGGDRISARFMRGDFFEFQPNAKLFMVANHRPALRNVDEAIRRRLHMIAFDVTIPEADRDPELFEKLKAEWPGILAWGLAGLPAWQADGLAPPPAVVAATDSYLAQQDVVAQWLAEECVVDAFASDLHSHLFAAWSRWCSRSGDFAGSGKRFTERMVDRGFRQARQGGTGARMLCGVRLKAAPAPED